MNRQGFYATASRRVWKGGTRNEVKFRPLARKQAARLYHDARRFERQTRITKNRQDGKLGRNALAVLHALLFDFLDYVSGRVDPGYAAIARAANISMASVWRGLKKLKSAGVLAWTRRLHWDEDGQIHQDTNAYAIQEQTTWKGFSTLPPAPAPDPEAWGARPAAHPDDLVEAALSEGDREALQRALDLASSDGTHLISSVLARLNKRRGEK